MTPRVGSDNNILETKFAELSGKIEMYMEQNSKQHEEIYSRLFADSPNSVQGQINAFNDRAFGDSPTSLKSQIIDIRESSRADKAYIAGSFTVVGALSGLAAMKWHEIIGFFKSLVK